MGSRLAKLAMVLALFGGTAPAAFAQSQPPASAPAPAPATPDLPHQAGDYLVRNFHFRDGQTLPEVRIHYTTLGQPRRDAQGRIVNAVMVLHGTGGDGQQFFRGQFAGVLFIPGGLLDIRKYYVILPDDIGHGKSSKPSDGLHMRFPHYDYADMVDLEHALATQGLGVKQLRLVMGTSMGCMHAFLWGEMYPDDVKALQPMACAPVRIGGRNRIWRAAVIDAIKSDSAWQGGEYKTQPKDGLRTASDLLMIAGSAPIQMQYSYPTPEAGEAYLADYTAHNLATLDANDVIYQFDSSRDYDPEPNLEKIKVPVMWINSADDFINPPDLKMDQRVAGRVAHLQFIDIPASLQTHGHGTHTWAADWQDHLAELLKQSATADMP
jgi:homoserine O-acetyltransferase/O-succinyltransferase